MAQNKKESNMILLYSVHLGYGYCYAQIINILTVGGGGIVSVVDTINSLIL